MSCVRASAPNDAAPRTIQRARRSRGMRKNEPSASAQKIAPTWCAISPLWNSPCKPRPYGVETSRESSAAKPAALRRNPYERATNATASGKPAKLASETTFIAPAVDRVPRVRTRTTPTVQVRPGPYTRNSWWPRKNRENQPSSRPWKSRCERPKSARTSWNITSLPAIDRPPQAGSVTTTAIATATTIARRPPPGPATIGGSLAADRWPVGHGRRPGLDARGPGALHCSPTATTFVLLAFPALRAHCRQPGAHAEPATPCRLPTPTGARRPGRPGRRPIRAAGRRGSRPRARPAPAPARPAPTSPWPWPSRSRARRHATPRRRSRARRESRRSTRRRRASSRATQRWRAPAAG